MTTDNKKHILCTGGAGYIGSHTVISLMEAGYDVSIFDNYYNSHPDVIKRIEKIAGRPVHSVVIGDIKKSEDIQRCFDGRCVDAVVHFAGLKAVGESVSIPNAYYETNMGGTIQLLEVMERNSCRNIIFSSSATVYKPCEELIHEDMPLGCANPYGFSKLFAEQVITDYVHANRENQWKGVILRYFNPIGNHHSGTIGESPKGTPNNLLPYVQKVAVGQLPCLSVFGNDWPTPDGTGVRDYIHVSDLADAHLASVDLMMTEAFNGTEILNVGTGKGFSVMEMLSGFEEACGHKLAYKIGPRREGDLATVIADPSKAQKVLNWSAKRPLEQGLAHAWKWQSNNPNGYWEVKEA